MQTICHDSRQKTRTTGSVGAMERCVQEGRTDNEPGEDRRDAGLHQREDLNINLNDKSSTKWMALCNLEEWLMRMSIQR